MSFSGMLLVSVALYSLLDQCDELQSMWWVQTENSLIQTSTQPTSIPLPNYQHFLPPYSSLESAMCLEYVSVCLTNCGGQQQKVHKLFKLFKYFYVQTFDIIGFPYDYINQLTFSVLTMLTYLSYYKYSKLLPWTSVPRGTAKSISLNQSAGISSWWFIKIMWLICQSNKHKSQCFSPNYKNIPNSLMCRPGSIQTAQVTYT